MQSLHVLLKPGDQVALVGCSDGRPASFGAKLQWLRQVLQGLGLVPVADPTIFAGAERDRGSTRAEALLARLEDPSIAAVFDVTGGDLANDLLDALDYDRIAATKTPLFGYSDLTCVLNAVYAKTGKAGCLYQVLNLVGTYGPAQQRDFVASMLEGRPNLFTVPCHFLRGDQMEGVLVGGNLRCLLKLAGTAYFPNLRGKLLLLEAHSGGMAQLQAYLAQLRQLGAFAQLAGILLGTFTELEARGQGSAAEALVQKMVPAGIPVAKTEKVGHGDDAKAVWIGAPITLTEGGS